MSVLSLLFTIGRHLKVLLLSLNLYLVRVELRQSAEYPWLRLRMFFIFTLGRGSWAVPIEPGCYHGIILLQIAKDWTLSPTIKPQMARSTSHATLSGMENVWSVQSGCLKSLMDYRLRVEILDLRLAHLWYCSQGTMVPAVLGRAISLLSAIETCQGEFSDGIGAIACLVI